MGCDYSAQNAAGTWDKAAVDISRAALLFDVCLRLYYSFKATVNSVNIIMGRFRTVAETSGRTKLSIINPGR